MEKQREIKPKQAIALEYDPSEDAPKVIASGRGLLAERIIERAKEADVPIHQDSKLADTLSRLEIGEMFSSLALNSCGIAMICGEKLGRMLNESKKSRNSI